MQIQISTVLQAVALLSDKVAADNAAKEAVAPAMERSAVKGEDYEQKVVQIITAIAAGRGDIAEAPAVPPAAWSATSSSRSTRRPPVVAAAPMSWSATTASCRRGPF